MAENTRQSIIQDFEDDAEVLFVQHLDLLAQLEMQLRAVHHTMRAIERLRGGSRRVGPELANGERENIPRWTAENRPLADVAKAAISAGERDW